jgi:acyl-CoA reductase-like NAD-dependent aldehyde dehydrogenase
MPERLRGRAGVVLGIAPWNAPVILAVRAMAMPLACGNAVVLKSSELCPATHQLIGIVLQEAGPDGGIVNVLSNAPDGPAVGRTAACESTGQAREFHRLHRGRAHRGRTVRQASWCA